MNLKQHETTEKRLETGSNSEEYNDYDKSQRNKNEILNEYNENIKCKLRTAML